MISKALMSVIAIALSSQVVYAAEEATATPSEKKWACEAAYIQDSQYTGGSHAYIHLSPYRRGDNYPVTKNADGSVSGTTGNGTSFTCRVKQ